MSTVQPEAPAGDQDVAVLKKRRRVPGADRMHIAERCEVTSLWVKQLGRRKVSRSKTTVAAGHQNPTIPQWRDYAVCARNGHDSGQNCLGARYKRQRHQKKREQRNPCERAGWHEPKFRPFQSGRLYSFGVIGVLLPDNLAIR